MADFAMTIDGLAVGGSSFAVINPATARVLAHVPICTPAQVDRAMAAAARAYSIWRRSDEVRRAVLGEAASALLASGGELARLITAEQGKPGPEAVAELQAAVAWLRHHAEVEVAREVVRDDGRGFAEVLRRPLGVIAAITPWSCPIALALRTIAPALRAGNTVVLKPSPNAPLATLALGRLLNEVLPPGVLNVVSGPDPLGAVLTAHRTPRMVSFAGSVATGRRVATAAAADLKRTSLELGGNDPAIVLEDADPEAIADGLFWGAFGNNGQLCTAIKRVYVAQRRYDEVVAALAVRARTVRVEDGSRTVSQLGPVGTRAQLDRVAALVRDALAHGAVVAAGGTALNRPGFFYAPTILARVSDGVRVVDEEQFGPVLPVIGYRDVEEAVQRATRTGSLTASVWSADPERATAVAARLHAGQVSVNSHPGGPQQLITGLRDPHEYTERQLLTRPAAPPARHRSPRASEHLR